TSIILAQTFAQQQYSLHRLLDVERRVLAIFGSIHAV
ncbi:hypothetical protein D046_3894B, partial [Vibrio parahaemolyticus V-223/04]